jgi:hypothetical protein
VEIIDPGRLICDFHSNLLPLFPRRGWLRCASNELNYTRIACNSKSFLTYFSVGAATMPSPLTEGA